MFDQLIVARSHAGRGLSADSEEKREPASEPSLFGHLQGPGISNCDEIVSAMDAAGVDGALLVSSIGARPQYGNHKHKRAVWMAEPEAEAAWRAEFKRIGETQVRDALNSITDEPKRQAAIRWLGDEAEARRLREEQTHHYVRWTFFAAVAAVIVGLIGVGLALLQ